MTSGLQYLQYAMSNRNLIPVVGAGFSAAVANLPSWPRLVDLGVEYIRANLPALSADKRFEVLEAMQASGDLLGSLSYLQKLLGGNSAEPYDSIHYQGFINEIFHNPPILSEELGKGLRQLESRVLLTTNYDLLLEDLSVTRGSDSATWIRPSEIRSMVRSGSGIVHIHGRYDLPRSLIFSESDYKRLVDDEDATAIAQAVFHSGVLLFIGSSVDGVADPHMAVILGEFARMADQARGERAPHVALVCGRPTGAEVARCRRLGVEVLSYGMSFDELPGFLSTIASRESIAVSSVSVRSLVQAVSGDPDRQSGLTHVADFIRSVVFAGREVRVTFAEKANLGSQEVLLTRHVVPSGSTRNLFNYPLSIAAWALIEGRIIAWPDDRLTPCDFDLIDRLNKRSEVEAALYDSSLDSAPEIRRFVDIDAVRARFHAGTLTPGDFFQDWSSRQPNPRYDRFACVPVPMVESFGNRATSPEFGVFNIDAMGGAPLLDQRSVELLKFAAAVATIVCQRFA